MRSGRADLKLTARLAQRLAREYLTAGTLPATVRVSGRDYLLFQAGGKAGLTGWFLACAADSANGADRVGGLRESAAELAADVALERARLDAGCRAERRLGQQIVTRLAAAGGGPAAAAEVAALMRAAELPAGGQYLAIAARTVLPGDVSNEAGHDLADLIEELAAPSAGRTAVGLDAGEVLALVPADPEGDLAARLREAGPVLAAGLHGGRLTVGISGACQGSGNLAGAVREARGARRLAELRPGRISVATGDEAGTHAMLLASVPADVLASFRDRLLGPLLRYDRQRGAGLVVTLAEFLACSGSWNVCAARLHVHVNTLRYRIRRIEELTGRDLSTLDHQVDFYLALNAAGVTRPRDAAGTNP